MTKRKSPSKGTKHKKAIKQEASAEIKEAIKRCVREGKAKFAGDVTKMNLRDPDFTVTKANISYAWHQQQVEGPSDGFEVSWETASAGFGSFKLYTKGGKLYCDNEIMSKFFILGVLYKLLDGAELTEPSRFEPPRKARRAAKK